MNKKTKSEPMTREALIALKRSIAKWQDKLKLLKANVGQIIHINCGPTDCPLCLRFGLGMYNECCTDCPIRKRTGRKYCYGTPYYQVKKYWNRPVSQKLIAACKSEVDFLKSLLPAKKGGNK